MAFTPISNTVPQYEENGIAASGFYIKFYEAGTTTPTAMATDSTGGTLLDKCELDTEGYPINGSSAAFIPHIDKKYKIALFRNEADADSNNLANAAWVVDDLFPFFTSVNVGKDFDQTPLNTDIIYPVSNVEALRELTGISVGQSFYLDGHTSVGIGGGELLATKLHTSEVDNNGNLFVVDGVVIERPDTGYITASEFGSIPDWDGATGTDNTENLQSAINYIIENSYRLKIDGRYMHKGLEAPAPINSMEISGYTWDDELYNSGVSGEHSIYFSSTGPDKEIRAYGVVVKNLKITGNPLSGKGIYAAKLGWYNSGDKLPSPSVFDHLWIQGHGDDGIQLGESSTVGAGNAIQVTNSLITQNGRTGVVMIANTNLVTVSGNMISLNGRDGVEINQVASTNTIERNYFTDNTRFGVYCNRAEEPLIMNNGFNRQGSSAVLLSGNATGSIKYTEAAVISGNLFGDNGITDGTAREVSVTASKGISIHSNYFYGTGQDEMIYLGDYVEGASIRANHYKDLTSEEKLVIKSGAIDTYYTFEDFGEDILRSSTIIKNGIGECIKQENITPTNVIDMSGILSNFAKIDAMTENVTSILFPLNPIDDQRIAMRIKQGSGAAYTVSGWPSNVRLSGGSFTATPVVGKQDYIEFRYSFGSAQWIETSRSQDLNA